MEGPPNAALNQRVDERLDLLEACFALGADALNAKYLEPISAAEVVEGVMSGDENPCILWNARKHHLGIARQPIDLSEVERGIGFEDGLPRRIEL